MNAELTPGHRQPIVVVEDDAGMSKAIARLLRAAGFESTSFASAEELLQTKAAESAACLVLDIHLPGISGLELGRLLVTSGRASAVIFVTAQDEAAARQEAQRLGCGYFRKPFEGKALLEAIREAIRLHPKPSAPWSKIRILLFCFLFAAACSKKDRPPELDNALSVRQTARIQVSAYDALVAKAKLDLAMR
jgi:Response regulator